MGPGNQRAFTLVELMLVMALLVIAMGITYPALRGFFRGRDIDSEARRFLALTRYAQSQAISSGVPMKLWIDVATGTYGLQPYPGFIDANNSSLFYDLQEGLELEVPANPTGQMGQGVNDILAPESSWSTSSSTQLQTALKTARTQPGIGFRPDGTLDESSPQQIILRARELEPVWIVQSSTRLAYEIVHPQNR